VFWWSRVHTPEGSGHELAGTEFHLSGKQLDQEKVKNVKDFWPPGEMSPFTLHLILRRTNFALLPVGR
jgi:hypothetical protein